MLMYWSSAEGAWQKSKWRVCWICRHNPLNLKQTNCSFKENGAPRQRWWRELNLSLVWRKSQSKKPVSFRQYTAPHLRTLRSQEGNFRKRLNCGATVSHFKQPSRSFWFFFFFPNTLKKKTVLYMVLSSRFAIITPVSSQQLEPCCNHCHCEHAQGCSEWGVTSHQLQPSISCWSWVQFFKMVSSMVSSSWRSCCHQAMDRREMRQMRFIRGRFRRGNVFCGSFNRALVADAQINEICTLCCTRLGVMQYLRFRLMKIVFFVAEDFSVASAFHQH